VFKLKKRVPEGKILTVSEIEEFGYEFAVLTKLNFATHNMNYYKPDDNEKSNSVYNHSILA